MRLLIAMSAGLGALLIYDGVAVKNPGPSGWMMPALRRLVAESGIEGLTGRRLVGGSSVLGGATFLIVAGVSSSAAVALAVGTVAALLPYSWARSRREARRSRFRDSWPDALASLIASVRAGVSLPEACGSLAERGPEDLKRGFTVFNRSYRATGSFRTGLISLQQDMADPVADRVVAALLMAYEVGGSDLVRLLRTLTDFIREDIRVRKEIQARWSWTVTAARVAAAAPWVVLLMMSTRPEAAAAYNSGPGVLTILFGAVATFVGYRLMLRAARLPSERRLTR